MRTGIIRYIKQRQNHFRLRRFQDKFKGQKCFIIGNGPSLTVSDLERIQSEQTFASNMIYLIFGQTSWRPKFLVLEDAHVIKQHHQEIIPLKGFTKFINSKYKSYFRKDRNALWYVWFFPDDFEFPSFSTDPIKGLNCGYMVTYISLQLAFFMGFTQVYLIGVDFNYSVGFQGDNHEIRHNEQQDHFIRNYYKPGETRYVPKLELAEMAFRHAKNFYEERGRKIFNATRGGKLEVFDRISLDEALRD